jgi:hypothetical protein
LNQVVWRKLAFPNQTVPGCTRPPPHRLQRSKILAWVQCGRSAKRRSSRSRSLPTASSPRVHALAPCTPLGAACPLHARSVCGRPTGGRMGSVVDLPRTLRRDRSPCTGRLSYCTACTQSAGLKRWDWLHTGGSSQGGMSPRRHRG